MSRRIEVEVSGGSDPTGNEEFEKSKEDIEKAAEGFGKTSLPYLTLLRLGWMF